MCRKGIDMNENFGAVAHVESYGVTVSIYGTLRMPFVKAMDLADWIDHRLGRTEVMVEKIGVVPYRDENNEPYYTLRTAAKTILEYFPRGNGKAFLDVIHRKLKYLNVRDGREYMNHVDDDKVFSMNQFAGTVWNRFSIGHNKLYRWMVNHGYIYKTPENKYMPYQRYIDYGWFVVNPLKDDRSYTEITSLGSLMLMESLERHN